MGTLVSSILSNITDAPILREGYYIDPGALGNFAKAIIEGVGIIGVGIILFALVLKAITLPFDIYQRVKMRKQTLIMRKMGPELEKLQKQYANDKGMYNQKMMELYKKNGYSMLGACIPMIISMVILIIAFTGFRGYSTSANLAMYEKMSHAYNGAIAEYIVEGKDYHLPVADKDADELTIHWNLSEPFEDKENGILYTVDDTIDASSENPTKYLIVQSNNENDGKSVFYWYPLFEDGKIGAREYKINKDKLLSNAEIAAKVAEIQAGESEETAVSQDEACRLFLAQKGAIAAREWYEGKGAYEGERNNAHFLWIKNVWYPDVSYDHPIQSYKSFSSQFGNVRFKEDKHKDKLANVLDETKYNYLTMELTSQKKAANGYYILIILSIGLMVASQLISMKSQKETNKYQTVDGSGATMQKVMLFAMPIIYAVFAFLYSAAFSVYMVMSSFISIVTMLITNLIIDHVFHKKEVEEIKEKNSRIPAWMKEREAAQNGKKSKKEKKSGK